MKGIDYFGQPNATPGMKPFALAAALCAARRAGSLLAGHLLVGGAYSGLIEAQRRKPRSPSGSRVGWLEL